MLHRINVGINIEQTGHMNWRYLQVYINSAGDVVVLIFVINNPAEEICQIKISRAIAAGAVAITRPVRAYESSLVRAAG